jgi:hypothetical protein
MTRPPPSDSDALAAEIDAAVRALPSRSTAPVRHLRRAYSKQLRGAEADYVLDVAARLTSLGHDWFGWELLRYHPATFDRLDAGTLEGIGAGIDSWDDVDGFARVLTGPAWLRGLIGDDDVHRWARSPDLWWRRAALVCTVALNMRSQGGYGDVARTLAVCEMLATDRERMVQQAISWALRELVVHDAAGVEAFVGTHEADLSTRTKREVRHKLVTGLKDPRRRSVAVP